MTNMRYAQSKSCQAISMEPQKFDWDLKSTEVQKKNRINGKEPGFLYYLIPIVAKSVFASGSLFFEAEFS